MLASLSPGELPDETPARHHHTDVASFQSLWENAKGVDAGCVSKDATAMAGWAVDGGFSLFPPF
jgi:hypothetical protein